MKILLDENFPLGYIITLGWRGATDRRIRERLQDDQTLFLTQDEDFLFGESVAAIVVVSRVRQSRRLHERIEVWRHAAKELTETPRAERLFELTDEGVLLPWRDGSGS